MLQVFDAERGVLLPATSPLGPVGWVHTEDPSDADLKALVDLGVPDDLPRHLQDPFEIARLDRSGDAHLLVLRVPRPPVALDTPYTTAPLGIVLLGQLVVTVASSATDVIPSLLQKKNVDVAHPERFVLEVMMCMAESFIAHVHTIDLEVEKLEDELEASLRNQEVLTLLKYEKSLTHFTTALASNRLMLERLRKDTHFPFEQADRELLEDTLVEIQQAIEMTSISSNILSQMMDAFASIISNNLNSVMKILTSLTIVLTFPVILASFYGMNVTLPAQHHPLAFWMTVVSSALVSALVARVFWKRRWL